MQGESTSPLNPPRARATARRRIRRIQIENFRNFRSLNIEIGDHLVIVGENSVGKSNLIHALRLLLDPALPDAARQLGEEDFWDGVPRPLSKKDEIRVAVDLADFEDDDGQLALLAEYLIEPEPMLARLTYLFRARTDADDPPRADQFEFVVFGGDREDARVGYDVRRRLPLSFLHALRDVESDLANWKRSPLRPLLERVWSAVGDNVKEQLKNDLDNAADALDDVTEISALGKKVDAEVQEVIETVGASAAAPERPLPDFAELHIERQRPFGPCSASR